VAESARIVGVGIVGNEADVIEAFVRHHARILDSLVLVVHQPVDSTAEILARLKDEGLPLDLRPAADSAFRQPEETSAVARELLRDGVAFVVPLDADEFLRLPDPGYLKRALPALPAGRYGAWRWQSYVPTPGDDPGEPNPVRRIRHRRRAEGIDCFKVVLTREFLHDGHFLLQGNHCVMRAAPDGENVAAPMVELKSVRLAHFPVRSRNQFETKVVIGELRNRGQAQADHSLGAHWRHLYGEIRDRGGLGPEALRQVAVRYPFPWDAALDLPPDGLVDDPLPVDFDLRYAGQSDAGALQNLLRWLDAARMQPARAAGPA
jgi:hypothetical protein